ncbi:MAG: Ig-like domain-containing protein [Pseudomonadota bacterium]|nr:Ig-like domain-containing protein [Pseudomonadota bacterium]
MSYGRLFTGSILVLLTVLTACSKDPILGVSGISARFPTVTAVTPLNAAVGVATTNPVITATFSEPMKPLVPANFTVTCAAPCVNATGTVTLDSTNTIATFTPALSLTANTLYTATVSAAMSLTTGFALANPYVWTFKTGTASAPTVTATAPANNASGVATNLAAVTAQFDQPMAPISGAATFTLTCTAPCVNPAGTTVALDSSATIATLTLGAALASATTYTATITGATSLATSQPLANPYVWTFTTGAAANATRPRVTLTVPATSAPGPTTGVPSNTTISAAFSEDMTPATLSATSFTVTCVNPCVSPAGTVTYDVGSRTAVFSTQSALTVGATYTATITTAAMDLQGNALAGNQAALPAASNYLWTFTASAPTTPTAVSVQSTNPTAGQSAVCPSASINATFKVPAGLRMDPRSITTATFTVTGPAPAQTPVTASSVTLDSATGTIASFTPQNPLTSGTTYTATIKGGPAGVKDSAVPADTMNSNFVWMFTAGPATGSCVAAVPLNSVSTYGTFGGTAGMTNTGILTVINGDIGTIATATSSITGFHDTHGDIYSESPANIGAVNGTIFTCTNSTTGPTAGGPNAANCAAATQARLDAQKAYNALVAFPPGANPGANLGSLTLAPGVYTSPSGSLLIQGGDLTLDAKGNANAIWVFQMASTLTVGGPGATAPQSIILAGGAQAKNVFWQVGTAATINAGGGGTMVGTIIAQAGVTFSTVGNTTITTLNGRALSLGASVTMVDTVINVPAP